MGLKIDELRSFVAVAATGSFSEAARKIRRAQSVVSMHISGMEAELGYKLFDRTPKPVLTPRGTELLVGVQRLLAEADRLETRALSLTDTPSPALYMGIDLVLEAPVMIDWLRLFARRFPSVRLQVENITGSEADWFFSRAGMNLALIFASSPSSHCDERLLGHSPVSIVVAKTIRWPPFLGQPLGICAVTDKSWCTPEHRKQLHPVLFATTIGKLTAAYGLWAWLQKA